MPYYWTPRGERLHFQTSQIARSSNVSELGPMVSKWDGLSLGHDLSVSSSIPQSCLGTGHGPFLHAVHSLYHLVSPDLYYQPESPTLLSVFTSMSQMPNGRRERKVSQIHTAWLLERFLPSFLQSRMSLAPALPQSASFL